MKPNPSPDISVFDVMCFVADRLRQFSSGIELLTEEQQNSNTRVLAVLLSIMSFCEGKDPQKELEKYIVKPN